jgi:hypothetical protein
MAGNESRTARAVDTAIDVAGSIVADTTGRLWLWK